MDKNYQDSRSKIFALLPGYLTGMQGIALLPFCIGSIIDSFDVSQGVAGGLATIQLGILAFVSLFLSSIINRVNRRWFLFIGTSISIFGNFLSIIAVVTQSIILLFVARMLTGFGEGVAVATISAVAASTVNPTRTFAYMNGYGVIIIGCVFLTSPALIESYGASGLFGIMMSIGIIAIASVSYVPNTKTSNDSISKNNLNWNFGLKPWLCLLLIGAIAIATGGVWAFAERVGVQNVGLPLQNVGVMIAVAAFVTPIGPIMANLIGNRFGRTLPVTTGLALYILVAFVFAYTADPALFFIGVVGHSIVSVFLGTYLAGFFSFLDPSGRVVAASLSFTSVGNAIGPSIMAFAMVYGSGYEALGWTALFLLSLTIVCFFPILWEIDKKDLVLTVD